MSNDIIKGKHWTLRLKNKYTISDELLPQKDNSHQTIPQPSMALEIACWNEKHDLSFFTHNSFGYHLDKTLHNGNSTYHNGYMMEVQIKLSRNLPDHNITSFNKVVMTDHNNFSPSINMKRDAYRDAPSMMYYRMINGIYPQWVVNKRTGSYLMYKLSMEGEESDRWGDHQYPTGNNQVVFKFADRKNDIYSTSFSDRNVYQNYEEDKSYIGRPAFIESMDKNITGFDAIRSSYLRMARSYVYPRQFHPSYNIKNHSGDKIRQPNTSYSSGSFYRPYCQYTSLSNSTSIVHIHFASNSLFYVDYDRLNSNTASVRASSSNMDNVSLNSSTTYNLNILDSVSGNRGRWDFNDNNIIVCVNGLHLYALNIGNNIDLSLGQIKLPRKNKIVDSNGKFKFSSWRLLNYRNATKSTDLKDLPSMNYVRINNSNICVSSYGQTMYISKYNGSTNSFENAEVLNLPFMKSNSATYTASAINENNEIVFVDLYGGSIWVYQIENMSMIHSFGYNTATYASINNSINLHESDTIENVISVDVKHRTAIEQCEIVISPRELEDPNLVPLDGRILLKSDEPFLYSIFGDTYYTNEVSQNSFKLPDLRGRYPIGRKQDGQYDTIDAQIQAFSLESLSDFGFNPINNQIKKYYKSASAKKEVNLTNTKAVKDINLSNTETINTTRKSVSIDDKCYMFYIRKVN